VEAESKTPEAKICGVQTSEGAIAASQAGASHLGFIMAPSRRQVTLKAIAAIRNDITVWVGQNQHRRMPLLTAVVVNASIEELRTISECGAVDVIQLSGDERPEILDALEVPVFKAIRFAPDSSETDARTEIDSWLDHPRPAKGILVDAWHPESYGGTGRVANWSLASRLAIDYPIWLAGGLTPDNVAMAISKVKPFGVDVSSGVESIGRKDTAKILAFLKAAGRTGQT